MSARMKSAIHSTIKTFAFLVTLFSCTYASAQDSVPTPDDNGDQPISLTSQNDRKTEEEKAKDNESPFSTYKDNYLLMGWSDSALTDDLVFKFQVSAKLRLPVNGLFLSYTQRSFMDVLQDSAPFYDHNFEPEVFYVYTFSDAFTQNYWLRSLQFGYRHSSNGLETVNSRSWERIYLEAAIKKGGWYIRPTVWIPFFKDAGNSDIEKFYGYSEITIAYVWDNDMRLSGQFRLGTDFTKGNAKVDMTLPFQIFFKTLPSGWSQSNLWFQAWQGYGETLLGLHESSTAFAVGVGFRPDFSE